MICDASNRMQHESSVHVMVLYLLGGMQGMECDIKHSDYTTFHSKGDLLRNQAQLQSCMLWKPRAAVRR